MKRVIDGIKRLLRRDAPLKKYAWWICSYSIIILISILINLIGYANAIRVIEMELANTNASTIEHTKKIVDNYLSELDTISYNLVSSNSVTFLDSPYLSPDRRTEYAANIIRDINNCKVNSGIMENVYVILRERDICIDMNGITSLDNAFRISFSKYYPTKEAWLNDAFGSYAGGFKFVADQQKNQRMFLCRVFIGINFLPNRTPTVAIMTEVNSDQLNSVLSTMETVEGEGFYITSDSSGLLFASHPIQEWPLQSGQQEGTFVKRLFGQKQVVSVTKSELIEGLQYVRTLPNNSYLKNIRLVRTAFVVCYLLCIIFGGLLVLLFSQINVRKRRHMEEKLAQQAAYMHEEILRQILERKVSAEKADAAFLAEYNLQMQGKYFIVSVIDSVALNEFAEEENTVVLERIRRYFALYLPSVLEEGIQSYICTSNTMMVVVFNMQNESIDVLNICNVLSRMRSRVREDLGLDFICAVSRRESGMERLPEAFDEAVEAMNSRFLGQTDAIFIYDDDGDCSGRYMYDVETERKLSNFLMLGDRENASKVIEETFSYNVNVKRINLNMLRVLTSEIISTLLKVAAQIDSDESLDFKELYLFSTQVYNIKQIEQAKNELLKYVNLLCDVSATHAHAIGDMRCVKIQEYIAENYHNPDLNVNMMAGLFGITASWMSRYFKEQVGVGMTDYIVKYRIQRAKELLRDTSKTIKQVAEETGFLSASVFLRAFKRYEGVTPGQYRECLSGKEE